MLVKVCGVKIPEQIERISQVSDYIGFIYYPKSPRYVARAPHSTGAQRVGVFVNERIERIVEIVERDQLDAVQLHGDEPYRTIAPLKNHVTVIKAFGMTDSFDFNSLLDYEGLVDYYLFDTKTPQHGGSGKQFNWDILNRYHLSTPFFLSGGIRDESLEGIKSIEHPLFVGVDINSGFEIEPGNKDVKRVKHFINEIGNNRVYATR